MKLRRPILILALVSISLTSAFAASQGASRFAFLAGKFLLQSEPATFSHDGQGCVPQDIGLCVKHVLNSNYSTQSERIEAARACAGNFGDSCAKFVVSSHYTTFSERVAAAKACRGNFDTECAKFVAGSSYSTLSERIQAAEACNLVSVSCVKAVVGSSYSTLSERLAAANACQGN